MTQAQLYAQLIALVARITQELNQATALVLQLHALKPQPGVVLPFRRKRVVLRKPRQPLTLRR